MLLSSVDRAGLPARTKAAQAGAVILLASGAAIAMMGLPGFSLPPAPILETGPVAIATPAPEQVVQPLLPVDFSAIADRLGLISNKPLLPPQDPATTDPTIAEIASPPPMAEIAKYLGPVTMGAVRLALIVKEEKQHFVKVGDKVGDATVESIGDTSLTFTTQGGTTTVEISPKGTSIVTVAGGGGMGGGPFAGAGNKGGAGRMPAQNQAVIAAQRAAIARGQVRNNIATPVGVSPAFAYGHILADPQRRARFTEIQAKLRGGGEFKPGPELDEAAAKLTEEEFQQAAGSNAPPAKGGK